MGDGLILKEPSNKNYIARICCSSEDKFRLNNECVRAFLEDNPKLDGIRFSEGFMLKKLIDYFLR